MKTTKIEKPTIEETLSHFEKNIEVPRDLIFVNIPSSKEIDALMETKSGLVTSQGKESSVKHNEFVFTVLAVGSQVSDYKAGDKVYLKIKVLDEQMIDNHSFAIVSPFQVIGKKK